MKKLVKVSRQEIVVIMDKKGNRINLPTFNKLIGYRYMDIEKTYTKENYNNNIKELNINMIKLTNKIFVWEFVAKNNYKTKFITEKNFYKYVEKFTYEIVNKKDFTFKQIMELLPVEDFLKFVDENF